MHYLERILQQNERIINSKLEFKQISSSRHGREDVAKSRTVQKRFRESRTVRKRFREPISAAAVTHTTAATSPDGQWILDACGTLRLL